MGERAPGGCRVQLVLDLVVGHAGGVCGGGPGHVELGGVARADRTVLRQARARDVQDPGLGVRGVVALQAVRARQVRLDLADLGGRQFAVVDEHVHDLPVGVLGATAASGAVDGPGTRERLTGRCGAVGLAVGAVQVVLVGGEHPARSAGIAARGVARHVRGQPGRVEGDARVSAPESGEPVVVRRTRRLDETCLGRAAVAADVEERVGRTRHQVRRPVHVRCRAAADRAHRLAGAVAGHVGHGGRAREGDRVASVARRVDPYLSCGVVRLIVLAHVATRETGDGCGERIQRVGRVPDQNHARSTLAARGAASVAGRTAASTSAAIGCAVRTRGVRCAT